MDETKYPKVSTITVNYNSEKYLRKCFYSIAKQDYPKDRLQIILVDNNSSDGSREYIKKAYKNALVVNSGYNAGYSGGGNMGYKHAAGEYVALMANDMIFPKNWIKKMADFMEKNKDVAIATATMVNGEDTRFKEGELLNASPVLVGREDTAKTGFTVVPWGGACMFRKSLFNPPFDSDYFIYGEDIYLGLMSWFTGYKTTANRIKVAHMGSITIGFNSPAQVYYNERNRLINMASFFKAKTNLALLPLVAADFFVKVLYFLKAKRPDLVKAELGAFWWNIKNFKAVLKKRCAVQKRRKVPDHVMLSVLCENIYGNGKLKGALNTVSIGYFRFVKWLWKVFGV